MEEETRRIVDEKHVSNLEATLRELQSKVREREEELERLRVAPPSQTARLLPKTAPMEIMKIAFDDVTQSTPFLPFPGSVLPGLLALRKTEQTIAESRVFLASQGSNLEKTKRELESEQAALQDQRVLTKALENRIQALKDELASQMEMTPEQVAEDQIKDLEQKKKKYDRDTGRLLKALNKFIDKHLAAMLAAEDLGGPVVGDMMEVDSDDLVVGFNAQGKVKKTKSKPQEDQRQQRLDQLWGTQGNSSHRRPDNEVTAAGQELRQLTEELLNQHVEASGDSSASYVKLDKETAAARFLVRSKVAQFHPKDSTRLRLIDFGRELDD